MGTKLFGIDIAKQVNSAMGKGLLPATLTHYTPGARTPTDPTAGTNPSSSRHSARGFFDDYRDSEVDGKRIMRGDRKVLLLGDSISPSVKPAPGDEVTIDSETMRVVDGGVQSDPAKATYTCQCRAF